MSFMSPKLAIWTSGTQNAATDECFFQIQEPRISFMSTKGIWKCSRGMDKLNFFQFMSYIRVKYIEFYIQYETSSLINFSEFFHTFPNFHPLFQFVPFFSKKFKNFLKFLKFTNLFKLLPAFPNFPKLFQTFSNVFQLFQTFPIFSKI